MNYHQIVDVVKEVTKVDIPVYFNDNQANYGGSAYFGLGEHSWDIVPDDFLDGAMFEVEDFIENKHIDYYHVGLPNQIEQDCKPFIIQVTQQQFNERGLALSVDQELLETFVILHEFGHAKQLLVDYQKDVEAYLRDTNRASRYMNYFIRSNGHAGTKEGLRLHKSLETEQFADDFALTHIEEVVKRCKELGYMKA